MTLGVVVHACTSSTLEVEDGKLGLLHQTELHKVSGYTELYSKGLVSKCRYINKNKNYVSKSHLTWITYVVCTHILQWHLGTS